MQNETIDKLKEAGYITVTDDSQGIADKVGVPEAFPYEYIMLDKEYSCSENNKIIDHIDNIDNTIIGSIFNTDSDVKVVISGLLTDLQINISGQQVSFRGIKIGVANAGLSIYLVLPFAWPESRLSCGDVVCIGSYAAGAATGSNIILFKKTN